MGDVYSFFFVLLEIGVQRDSFLCKNIMLLIHKIILEINSNINGQKNVLFVYIEIIRGVNN